MDRIHRNESGGSYVGLSKAFTWTNQKPSSTLFLPVSIPSRIQLALTQPTINDTMKLYIEIDLEAPSVKKNGETVHWNNVAFYLEQLRDRLLANKYEKKRGAIENVDDVVTAYMEEN